MTKEEIYEAIGYKGKYNKEVKRKLRLLMKKFHPDLNHDDINTMKLLVEVKNELINHKVSYKKIEETKKEKKQQEEEKEENKEDDFKNISIKALTNKVNQLLKELEKVQEALFSLYKKLTKEEEKYFSIGKEYKDNTLKVKEGKEKLLLVKKVSKMEIFFLSLSIINICILFIHFRLLFLFTFPLFLFSYLICFLLRCFKMSALTNKVYDLEIDQLILKKELEVQDEVVGKLKYQEGINKRKIGKIKDDITFYNHVIADKTNKTKTNEYDRKDVYTKRK